MLGNIYGGATSRERTAAARAAGRGRGRGSIERGGRAPAAMAQQRVLPQSKETLLQSYNKRLKDDVKSIMDNFTEIIKTAKVGPGRSRAPRGGGRARGSTRAPEGRGAGFPRRQL